MSLIDILKDVDGGTYTKVASVCREIGLFSFRLRFADPGGAWTISQMA